MKNSTTPFSLLAALLALALGACATAARQFPEPDPTWRRLSGQLRYQTPESSVIGDVVIRSQGDEFQLDFASGPGFPLLKWRQSGSYARAEGILARGAWQGDISAAPEPLQSWAKLAEKLETSPESKITLPIKNERFAFVFSGL